MRIAWSGCSWHWAALHASSQSPMCSAVQFQIPPKDMQDLKEYQRAHRLERLPTPLEGLSYLFAAGNLLAGPHFELSDYLAFVERRGPWDPSAPRPPPSSAWVGTMRMAKAVACLGIYLWLGQLLPIAVVQVRSSTPCALPQVHVCLFAMSPLQYFCTSKKLTAANEGSSAHVFSCA